MYSYRYAVNTLNAELNPICHLLALLAQHILHVSRIRVNTQGIHKHASSTFNILNLRTCVAGWNGAGGLILNPI